MCIYYYSSSSFSTDGCRFVVVRTSTRRHGLPPGELASKAARPIPHLHGYHGTAGLILISPHGPATHPLHLIIIFQLAARRELKLPAVTLPIGEWDSIWAWRPWVFGNVPGLACLGWWFYRVGGSTEDKHWNLINQAKIRPEGLLTFSHTLTSGKSTKKTAQKLQVLTCFGCRWEENSRISDAAWPY